MTDTPKRQWFRFHLSTAVLLVLVAAWLLMKNLVLDNVRGEYGWPAGFVKQGIWGTILFAIVNVLSAFLILFFVYKLSTWLNRSAGQNYFKSAKARLARTRPLTWIGIVIATAGIVYLNYSNRSVTGAWVNYGWPVAHAVRVYQLRRSYSWGFVANEYDYFALAVDLATSGLIICLVFKLFEWNSESAGEKAPG